MILFKNTVYRNSDAGCRLALVAGMLLHPPDLTKRAMTQEATSPQRTLGIPKPSTQEFYVDYALYQEVVFRSDELADALPIIAPEDTINAPCSECKEGTSIFRVKSSRTVDRNWFGHYTFRTEATCSRDSSHTLVFYMLVNGKSIQKIGQYPSLADLNTQGVKQYAKALPKKVFSELTKAIGLAAHGVGVGSFVYLRRIFEGLVEEAHQTALADSGWDEDAYAQARMSEKIALLAGHLPSFLVENKTLYGIMSKGIHELSEQECLAAFPVVKIGIELILDAKLEEKAKKEKADAARVAIQQLAQLQGSGTA